MRQWLHVQLDPEAWRRRGLSPLNLVITILILLSAAVAIAETEPVLREDHHRLFRVAEVAFGIAFLLEFAARWWVSAEGRGRLAFLRSPATWIDLAVLLTTFAPFVTGNGQLLRLVRLLNILRLAKLGRLSSTFRRVITAVASRRYELLLTFLLAMCLMIVGAAALYWAEGGVQPDKFGSIPRALWWSVVTLTTIGYGDVYPVTPLGKVIAAGVAFAGIGLIAMPAGILAAAFSDAMRRER